MDSLVCIRRLYLGLGGADPLAMPLHMLRLFLHGGLLKTTSRTVGLSQGTAFPDPRWRAPRGSDGTATGSESGAVEYA